MIDYIRILKSFKILTNSSLTTPPLMALFSNFHVFAWNMTVPDFESLFDGLDDFLDVPKGDIESTLRPPPQLQRCLEQLHPLAQPVRLAPAT